jgi:hypothetical protein
MVHGTKGIGDHKHGTSGHAPKSPKLRANIAREALVSSQKEQERKSKKGRILNPASSVSELFKKR